MGLDNFIKNGAFPDLCVYLLLRVSNRFYSLHEIRVLDLGVLSRLLRFESSSKYDSSHSSASFVRASCNTSQFETPRDHFTSVSSIGHAIVDVHLHENL